MTAMPLQPFTAAETAHLARIEAAEPVDAGQDARVETVARAICAADEFVDGDNWTWDDAGENAHAEYRRMATAALAAMHPAEETLRERVEALAGELDEDGHRYATIPEPYAAGIGDARLGAAHRLRAVLGGEL